MMRLRRDTVSKHRARLTIGAILAGLVGLGIIFLCVNKNPALLARPLGLEHRGPVPQELPSQTAAVTPDPQTLDHVDVLLPPPIADPLSLTVDDVNSADEGQGALLGSASQPGMTTYLLTFNEASLNRLVRTYILSQRGSDGLARDVTLDLQPGGLILYEEVNFGVRRHRVGLLMTKDGPGTELTPAGLVLEGELFAIPDSASLARMLLPTGREVQRTLDALTITGPLAGDAHPTEVVLLDNQLQIEADATYALSSLSDTGWRTLEEGLELREIDIATGADAGVERLRIVRLDTPRFEVVVRYDPSNPRMVSAWCTESEALLAVNGSYFTAEGEGRFTTLGLLISDGQRWGGPLQDFAGMLAVRADGDVSVRWLRQHPYDPWEPLTYAIQSFPVLVKPGGSVGFPAHADDGASARRTVVGQDREGNLLLLVAPRGQLSLHELSVSLADADLGIDVAVNLDGGRSTGMWMSSESVDVKIDSVSAVPSAIVVRRR